MARLHRMDLSDPVVREHAQQVDTLGYDNHSHTSKNDLKKRERPFT